VEDPNCYSLVALGEVGGPGAGIILWRTIAR
jgi:hypothetical protein